MYVCGIEKEGIGQWHSSRQTTWSTVGRVVVEAGKTEVIVASAISVSVS